MKNKTKFIILSVIMSSIGGLIGGVIPHSWCSLYYTLLGMAIGFTGTVLLLKDIPKSTEVNITIEHRGSDNEKYN